MTTRFCPTVNSPHLHLGHLYLLLVNRDEATATGGKFIVRFDDHQQWWRQRFGDEKIAEFTAAMKDDIAWLGLEPIYTSEGEEYDANLAMCKGKIAEQFLVDRGAYPQCPSITRIDRPFPYAPFLTALRVAQDYREGITKVIRGDDLCTEWSLYVYFCEVLGVPVPEHIYVPKLREAVNCGFHTDHKDLADVSKSNPQGTDWSIRRFRELMNPRALIARLADVCLKERHEPWLISNLRPNPHVYEGFEK